MFESDRELMRRLRKGNFDAFPDLYARFSKPVFKYVSRRIQPKHIAEELTQDIFLKIFQYRASYDPGQNASAWIWTIAKHTLYDYFRTKKLGTNPLQNGLQDWEPILEETAETLMIAELEKIKLQQMMTALSVRQKEAIFLRLIRRLSYQQISKSMDLSLSAVKSLLNRAKATLIKQRNKTI